MAVFIFNVMKEIKLSKFGKNKGLYVAMVDDEDFERVRQFAWSVQKGGNTYYAKTSVMIDGKCKYVFLHEYVTGSVGSDHIDGNGLNCQKLNLRKCTKAQNAMNAAPHKTGSSKYKGVTKPIGRNHFHSQIRINGRHVFIGSFTDEIEAAKSYDKKAIEFFGEFARLNFPE